MLHGIALITNFVCTNALFNFGIEAGLCSRNCSDDEQNNCIANTLLILNVVCWCEWPYVLHVNTFISYVPIAIIVHNMAYTVPSSMSAILCALGSVSPPFGSATACTRLHHDGASG